VSEISGEAIVLGRERTGDTSLRLVLLFAAHGRVRCTAKGALKPGSRLHAPDLLQTVDACVAASASGRAHYLRDAQLLDARSALHAPFERFALACYAAELTGRALHDLQPVPETHALLDRFLAWLETNEPTRTALVQYEWRLLETLGLAPGPASGALRHAANIFGQNFGPLPPARTNLLARLNA
jgi:DNA repair protein RecO